MTPPTATTEQQEPESKGASFAGTILAGTLRSILQGILILVDEVRVTIGPAGIQAQFVDAAHVAMGHLRVSKNAWSNYSLDGELDFAFDADALRDFLKLAGDKEPVSFEAGPALGQSYRVTAGGITRTFPVLDASALTPPKMPKLDLENKVQLRAGIVQRFCQAAGQVADAIWLAQAEPNSCTLVAEGDGAAKVECPIADGATVAKPGKTGFSLDYFGKVLGLAEADAVITASLSPDMPGRFTWSDADVSYDYLVAPRIDSE